MILGEDWLEGCSPMWVHCTKKIMRFIHNGTRVTLRGVRSEVSKCSAVSASRLKELLRGRAVTHCIQLLPKVSQQMVLSAKQFVDSKDS